MKRYLAIPIFSLPFVALFVVVGVAAGWTEALLACGLAAAVLLWVCAALWVTH